MKNKQIIEYMSSQENEKERFLTCKEIGCWKERAIFRHGKTRKKEAGSRGKLINERKRIRKGKEIG